MSKKINPSAIGAFVIGATMLLVFGLMIFGRGNLFEQKVHYQIFFDKSVNGLSIGSPVVFRGIRIGQVTDIRLALKVKDENETDKNNWPIQVTIKLLPKAFTMAEPDLGYNVHHIIQSFNPGESKEQMNNWLRNMVFDLFENEVTSTEIKQDFERGIIPSRMSAFERLYLSLNQKDFSGNVETFHTVMNFIGEFFQSGKAEAFVDNVVASSENLKQTTEDARDMLRTLRTYKKGESDGSPVAQLCDLIVALQGIVGKVDTVMTNVKQKLPRMMDDASSTLETLNSTTTNVAPKLDAAIADARQLIKTTEKTISLTEGPSAELVRSLQATMEATRDVMATAQTTLRHMDATLDDDSPLRTEIDMALEEIRQTAQSFRALVELIQRNPEILIHGRRD